MLIISLGENDVSGIRRILAKDRHDAIIFAMNIINTDLTSLCKAILADRPGTNIICIDPAMTGFIVEMNEDMQSDLAHDETGEMIVLCRDSYVRTHVMVSSLPPVTDEKCISKIMDVLNEKLPIPSPGSADTDDKLARIKDLRKYVCRRYPESCCAYNKPAETYYDLVNEVTNDFVYMVIGLCGCGCTDSSVEAIRDYLEIVRIQHTKDEGGFDKARRMLQEKFHHGHVCDDPLLQFMAYLLDDIGLTEHGTSIGGAWLTDEGEVCLEVLNMYLGLPDGEDDD